MFRLWHGRIVVRHLTSSLSNRPICSTIRRHSAKTSTSSTPNHDLAKKTGESSVKTHKPLSEDEIQKIINLDNIHIVTKVQRKKPQRPPLVQNFFVGKADRELLAYPQVMQVKDFNELDEKLKPVAGYFIESGKTPVDLRFRDVSREMISDFGHKNLFARSVNQKFGGLGYFTSESEWASECEAYDVKSFLFFAGHRLVVDAIFNHGTSEQQDKYLPELAKGELIGAACLHDPLGDPSAITVKTSQTPYGKEYILNGSKSFVVCSQHANLMLVVAENVDQQKEDDEEGDTSKLTILLDPKTPGITFSDEEEMFGCNFVPYTTVSFFNVRISNDQILSQANEVQAVHGKLIYSSRLQEATLNFAQIKKILNFLSTFISCAEYNDEKIRDSLYAQSTLGKLGSELYALESMIYLTAGIIDEYDNPKVELECAATKAYSQDLLLSVANSALSIIGATATVRGHPIEQEIKNGIQLQYHRDTSSSLKQYIAKIGMRHCFDTFGGRVQSYQDNIFMKLGLSTPTNEYIESKLYLEDYVHPTLGEMARSLDWSINRTQMASEILLHRYREEAFNRQMDLHDIGEIAMLSYAMFASIGRSSRAYCVGLRYSVYETVAAGCMIGPAEDHIANLVNNLKNKIVAYDEEHKKIAEYFIDRHKKKLPAMPSLLHTNILEKTKKS